MDRTDINTLKETLPYLKVGELQDLCNRLALPLQGKKGDLIHRILTFFETGKIMNNPPIPAISKSQKNELYPLAPETQILSGSYKNDGATRNFMKKLVGPHFHFTAFGQDWIKERWQQGNPPTYKEFAAFWKKEYEDRKKRKATPKKEWAYLNFIQRTCQENSALSRTEIVKAWEKHRAGQVKKAWKILKNLNF